jgi:hypothetical protein
MWVSVAVLPDNLVPLMGKPAVDMFVGVEFVYKYHSFAYRI